MTARVRTLRPDEHERLIGLGPFKDCGPDPATSLVVVAEDDEGKIVGYWCAFNAVHLEPLWVVEAARNDGVAAALWVGLREVLDEHGIANAFAMVADEDVMTHLAIAGRLGFRRVPASTLFIELNPENKTEGLIIDETGKDGG